MKRSVLLPLGALALLAAFVVPANALAQSTIKRPGDRPAYVFEAEPHLLFAPFDAPGFGESPGYGAGFRGTIELSSDGFIPKLNDSVGLGFGLDWIHYDEVDRPRGRCTRYAPAPEVPVCVEVDGGGYDQNYFYVPVVMQWNFWLHRDWSVFGEPGVALYLHDEGEVDFQPFVFYAGGRYHLSDVVTITMRLGYPSFSAGVSFLL